jgi:DNA-binding IclR family transcriptional regulator
LLRGLSLLTCFDADGGPRGIVDMAKSLDMSPSSAHRYALTLVHLGLLERSPRTRKYSLPRAARAQELLDRLSHATID